MRILFMGAGDIAVPAFQSLIGGEHELVALVTQPDRPVGRKQELKPSLVKQAALEAGIPVEQPESLKTVEALAMLEGYEADLFVVMAYGQILSQAVISTPSQACINLHASLLPKYRGASCIQAAIEAGDQETGITVMHVVKKLDAGDVILREAIEIQAGETAGELHDRLAELAPVALGKALEALTAGCATREVQIDSESSYAPKLGRHDGVIDWSRPAEEIERLIRAYFPWPGTSTKFESKGREKVLKILPPVEVVTDLEILSDGPREAGTWSKLVPGVIYCGEGALKLGPVQPEGSRAMDVVDFLNGNPQVLGA
mgnify:CR=1 FL=1